MYLTTLLTLQYRNDILLTINFQLHKMKRNHQNVFSIIYQKAGAWALVGAPKISNIQNFHALLQKCLQV